MNRFHKVLSVLLVLAMLLPCLAGCVQDPPATQPPTAPVTPTTVPAETTVPTEPEPTWPVIEAFELPEYALEYRLTEEDTARAEEMIALCRELSFSEAPREVVEAAWDNLDLFLDYYMTQVSMAQILYYQNINDKTLSQTYLDAYDAFLDLADSANMLQKEMYDDSPVKDWFFEDWTEKEIRYLLSYTSEIVALQSRLNELEVEFQDLQDSRIYRGFVPLYKEYVTVGNQIAALTGYENFYAYKSDLTYNRDYGKEELDQFHTAIRQELIPIFDRMPEKSVKAYDALSDEDYVTVSYFTAMDYDGLPTNYLQGYIDSWEGSPNLWFNDLFESGNYIASDSAKSYPGAFCASFDCYDRSFCYFGPGYQSTLTVVHEMGHYYASYFASDYDAFDLRETHSQGNEALLLAYLKEHISPGAYDYIRNYELYENAFMMLICTLVDAFEQRIYSMESVEDLTSDDIDEIISELCQEYGTGSSHFAEHITATLQSYIRQVAINSPCYYISYATSLVTTLNLLAQAEQDNAAARETYRKLCEETADMGYTASLAHAGAASPFDIEAIRAIADMFK